MRGMRKERKNGFHGNGPNGMVVCEREGKDRYRWEEGFKKLSNIFEIQTNGLE